MIQFYLDFLAELIIPTSFTVLASNFNHINKGKKTKKKIGNNDFSLADIKNPYCDSKVLKSGQTFTLFVQRVLVYSICGVHGSAEVWPC